MTSEFIAGWTAPYPNELINEAAGNIQRVLAWLIIAKGRAIISISLDPILDGRVKTSTGKD